MKQVPFVGQKFDYDCGPASATMVARGLGAPITLSEMTRNCGTSKKYGTTPEAMVVGLQRAGLEATIKTGLGKEELKELLQKDCLVILDYWDYDDGHYVVLNDIIEYSDGTSQIVVTDPAYDIAPDDPDPTTTLDWEYFYNNWFDFEEHILGDRRISDRLAIVVTRKQKKPTPKSTEK